MTSSSTSRTGTSQPAHATEFSLGNAEPADISGSTPELSSEPVVSSLSGKTIQRHLLDIDSLTKAEIGSLLDSAEGMLEVLGRDVKKTPALRGKTIVTVFYENSTRTRISFEEAGKILGADVINVSVSSSSVNKGESLYNTALTLQAMQVDALVIRHADSGAPHFVARHVAAPVVNAGDGMHAHPTQTLLDLFTLRQRLGDISGKRIAIVGDVLYSRVARSDIIGLLKMGANVVVCGPPTLMPVGWNPGRRIEEPWYAGLQIVSTVEEALSGADAVMALRIQKERQDAGHLPDLREYSNRYGINSKLLSLAKTGAPLMHPGPMNEGVEISSDVAHGAQSVIEEQVRNGVAVRMAVLYALCSQERQ
jgi:aspartate carbamoyltransferase catalytic subunit